MIYYCLNVAAMLKLYDSGGIDALVDMMINKNADLMDTACVDIYELIKRRRYSEIPAEIEKIRLNTRNDSW